MQAITHSFECAAKPHSTRERSEPNDLALSHPPQTSNQASVEADNPLSVLVAALARQHALGGVVAEGFEAAFGEAVA